MLLLLGGAYIFFAYFRVNKKVNFAHFCLNFLCLGRGMFIVRAVSQGTCGLISGLGRQTTKGEFFCGGGAHYCKKQLFFTKKFN